MAASTSTVFAGTDFCVTCQTLSDDKSKPGMLLCLGCQQSFCYQHIGQHRQQLTDQLDKVVVEEQNYLHEIISKLEENRDQYTVQLRKDIDDWERSSHEAINQIAERTREKLREMSLNECKNFQARFTLLSTELNAKRENETYFENDIEVLKRKFHQLKDDIENLGLKVDINQQLQSMEMIDIKNKPSSSDSFIDHLLLTQKPIKSINTLEGGTMYAINDNLLAIENEGVKCVSLYNTIDGSVKVMSRYGACASIMCYSTYLQSFLYFIRHCRDGEGNIYQWNVIVDGEHEKLELYGRQQVSAMTCYETKLILVLDKILIQTWNLNDRKLEKQWIPPISCEGDESILNIGMNSKYYAVIIQKQVSYYFQLRNTAMLKIGTVETESYGINPISLPDESGWFLFCPRQNDEQPCVIDNQLNIYAQKYTFDAKVRDIVVQGKTVIIRYTGQANDAKKSKRGLIEYYKWT